MLKESEWLTLNRILGELYHIDDFDTLAQKVMRVIPVLIPYTKGWFLLLDDDQNIDDSRSHFVGFDKNAEESYVHQFYSEDYIRYLYDLTSETVVYRDTDILDHDTRTKTHFYQQFLSSQDIIYGCGVMLIYGNQIAGFFNLFRDAQSGDFSKRDLYILEVLKKHLENMISHVIRLSRASVSIRSGLHRFSDAFQLTSREAEILEEIYDGHSNQQIADSLYISVSTVKKHIYHLFEKTEVSSRGQLISLLLQWQEAEK